MPEYIPPKVWKENTVNGGRFSTINKPTSGAQEERVLAVGKHPMQLYSLGTPNGVKVTIMLEELLAKAFCSTDIMSRPGMRNRP